MKPGMIDASSCARALAAIFFVTASACSSAPPPAPDAPRLMASAAPPSVASVEPPSPAPGPTALIDAAPTPSTSASTLAVDPAPSPSVAALASATRRFEPIALPSMGAVLAVDGRGPKDVWMLGENSALLRWNGARAERQKAPSCPSHVVMSFAGSKPRSYDAEPVYRRLTVAPREIIVGGPRSAWGYRGSYTVFVEARSRGGSAWSCGMANGFGTPIHRAAGDGVLDILRVGQPSFAIDDRPAPVPDDMSSEESLLVARSSDDVWIGSPLYASLWHWNGVAWNPRPAAIATLFDLWTDESGAAWVLGSTAKNAREGDLVLRWDLAAKAWRSVPLPPDLRATRLGGTSARDVWLFGTKAWFQWDGVALRRADALLGEVNATWSTATGELFVVGADRTKKVGTGKDATPAGAAFHALAVEEERP